MKSIHRFEYSHEHFSALNGPFPETIEENGWVIFHGTSNIYEERIESIGFKAGAIGTSLELVTRIVSLYESLWWCGDHLGGFGVLSTFTSADFERGNGSARPVFFGETGRRASLYAIRDYAGGEAVRAVRYAVEDLRRYVYDRDFRQAQLFQSWKHERAFFLGNVPGIRTVNDPTDASFDALHELWSAYRGILPGYHKREPLVTTESWLRQEFSEIFEAAKPSFDAAAAHKYGIVYAVAVSPDDTARFHNGAGGLWTMDNIPVDRILAKSLIPLSCKDLIGSLQWRTRESESWMTKVLADDNFIGRMRIRTTR